MVAEQTVEATREEYGAVPRTEEAPLTEREMFFWILGAVVVFLTFCAFGFVLLVLTKMPAVAN